MVISLVLTYKRIDGLSLKILLLVSLLANECSKKAHTRHETQKPNQYGHDLTGPVQHGMSISAHVGTAASEAKLVAGDGEARKQEDGCASNKKRYHPGRVWLYLFP